MLCFCVCQLLRSLDLLILKNEKPIDTNFQLFTVFPEQVTLSLSTIFLVSINQSFIHNISQLHSYGLSDSHSLLVLFAFVIDSGRIFNLLFLISRVFTFSTMTSITVSSNCSILIELRSSKEIFFR